jgi:hypothetical protein
MSDMRFFRAEEFRNGKHHGQKVGGWVRYSRDELDVLVPVRQGAHCEWPQRPPLRPSAGEPA